MSHTPSRGRPPGPRNTVGTARVQLPTGDPTRSREPSPATLWRASPSIMDKGTEDESEVHFTLNKSIDTSKFTHLFHIKPRLNATNYAVWADAVLRALQTVSLHVYLNADFMMPGGVASGTQHHPVRWQKANTFVCSVLTAAMTEERQREMGHLPTAAEIWAEARRLYATDWTFTIAPLVTARYNDGEDAMAHMGKMKMHRRDLLTMGRDIDDELFACFLRISMPSSWHDVFATLPAHYTSAEVERRIRDEYGVRMSQGAGIQDKKKRYCDNCKSPTHWTRDCWSKSREPKSKKQEEGSTRGEKDKHKQATKAAKTKASPNRRTKLSLRSQCKSQ